MTTTLATNEQLSTVATRQADSNFDANLSALAAHQPDLPALIRDIPITGDWLFARDGYLTAQTAIGWWTGCSVPLLTARQLLKTLDLQGGLGCFINPTHAAQLRACFEKIQPAQAIVAVIPDLESLATLLHCDDFSAEFKAARLFFVAGPGWSDQLASLFARFGGLALPQQFLRTSLLEDADMTPLTNEAQLVISRETSRRLELMPEILAGSTGRARTGRVLVLANSRFDLSDFSNLALRSALLRGNSKKNNSCFASLDPDHPLTASPLALLQAAVEADAFVAADLFRSDLPGVVPSSTAWITWLTTGRIVPPDPQNSIDGLLLSDPKWLQPALDAGWPAERIQTAAWPQIVPAHAPSNSPRALGLLADTRPIVIPQHVQDFSSQLLLWEMIEDELSNRPFSLGDNPQKYLQTRMARFNIPEENFDRALFVERLIVPAYQQGLARYLLRNKIPLNLFGRGWTDMPEFQPHATGPITHLDDLTIALNNCHALVHPFPDRPSITDALPLPVIHPAGLGPDLFLARIRQFPNTKPQLPQSNSQPLTRGRVLSLIPGMSWPQPSTSLEPLRSPD